MLRRGDLAQQAVPGAIVALYVVLSLTAPNLYEQLAQEDFLVEWLTFGLFGAAGLIFAQRAYKGGPSNAWCHAAVAAFCLLVAGEEISWGQRFFGFVPPKIFLAHNYQQEANLHNLIQSILQPKWLVVLVLVGWGSALPLLLTRDLHRRLSLPDSVREIAPSPYLIPWSAIGVALLVAYPTDFTGEYIELLTGSLFFVTAFPVSDSLAAGIPAAGLPVMLAATGFALMEFQARFGNESKVACARLETRALAAAIQSGGATSRLFDKDYVHKRLFSAALRKYLRDNLGDSLKPLACPGVSDAPDRRAYLLDPWGQPYWIRYDSERSEEDITATVYSFGPNRRRDSDRDERFEGTDDIHARTTALDPDLAEDDSEGDGPVVLR